ncbi:hypothetical protein Tco_0227017 [Tanacetum coccineum]
MVGGFSLSIFKDTLVYPGAGYFGLSRMKKGYLGLSQKGILWVILFEDLSAHVGGFLQQLIMFVCDALILLLFEDQSSLAVGCLHQQVMLFLR